MSTAGERLEATVWLDVRHPNLSEAQRAAFYEAVDEYYARHPIAGRRPHALDILQQDDHAFAGILRDILGAERPDDTGDDTTGRA